MPLGTDVSKNISELTHHGTRKRSRKQIIAIAMSAARKAKGSRRPRFAAAGGMKASSRQHKMSMAEMKKGHRKIKSYD